MVVICYAWLPIWIPGDYWNVTFSRLDVLPDAPSKYRRQNVHMTQTAK